MKNYDLIVLGGGAGGLTVASGAASLGATVALVEKSTYLGGDCLHYGCVPSKSLITSAKQVFEARKSAREFGMVLTGEADITKAMERAKRAIADIQVVDSEERFEKLGVDLYKGKGRFLNPHHVQVEDQTVIEGKRIVIATGSSPSVPSIKGLENITYLTNKTIFDVKKTPKRLVVVGGGPVGLELAQAFARFGSDVTVLESHSTIFPKEDAAIVPVITKALQEELSVLFEASVKQIDEENGIKKITYVQNGQKKVIMADEILIATGQHPNTVDLGLENIGVKVNDRGHILVNDYLQTSQPHIYAIGDVNGQFPFTHAAGMEGKLVVRNALFGFKGKVDYDNVPWITYTDPEVFHLGLTEQDAQKDKQGDIRTFKVETKEVDRFITERDDLGFVKILTNKKGHILGAHAVGRNAGDWMQELVFAKSQGNKIGDLSQAIHPYPTHGAILQQTADLYWREKLFDGALPKVAEKYIKWFR